MKKRLNVFVAVFISYLGGYALAHDGEGYNIWTALNQLFIVLNLYWAGFFDNGETK